jgi:hypothetical protein
MLLHVLQFLLILVEKRSALSLVARALLIDVQANALMQGGVGLCFQILWRMFKTGGIMLLGPCEGSHLYLFT